MVPLIFFRNLYLDLVGTNWKNWLQIEIRATERKQIHVAQEMIDRKILSILRTRSFPIGPLGANGAANRVVPSSLFIISQLIKEKKNYPVRTSVPSPPENDTKRPGKQKCVFHGRVGSESNSKSPSTLLPSFLFAGTSLGHQLPSVGKVDLFIKDPLFPAFLFFLFFVCFFFAFFVSQIVSITPFFLVFLVLFYRLFIELIKVYSLASRTGAKTSTLSN